VHSFDVSLIDKTLLSWSVNIKIRLLVLRYQHDTICIYAYELSDVLEAPFSEKDPAWHEVHANAWDAPAAQPRSPSLYTIRHLDHAVLAADTTRNEIILNDWWKDICCKPQIGLPRSSRTEKMFAIHWITEK
jgi:hypothetical protein